MRYKLSTTKGGTEMERQGRKTRTEMIYHGLTYTYCLLQAQSKMQIGSVVPIVFTSRRHRRVAETPKEVDPKRPNADIAEMAGVISQLKNWLGRRLPIIGVGL